MAGQIHPHSDTFNGAAEPVVMIVEDDLHVQQGLSLLLRSAGFRPVCFGAVPEFLKAPLPDAARCLITDVRLPQIGGLELQQELARRGVKIPIIFMTGHGDIPMSVRAMKAGAVDFLSKPFRDQDLLDAVNFALAQDRDHRKIDAGRAETEGRYETLTQREKEVMELVTRGLMNKQVAGKLGLSEITVKLHRARLMRKMGTRTLADLVRTSDLLRSVIPPPSSI